jgi:hypothetical protein
MGPDIRGGQFLRDLATQHPGRYLHGGAVGVKAVGPAQGLQKIGMLIDEVEDVSIDAVSRSAAGRGEQLPEPRQ